MARGKRSVHSKKRRRRILSSAEGYSGARSRHLRAANEQLLHSGQYALLSLWPLPLRSNTKLYCSAMSRTGMLFLVTSGKFPSGRPISSSPASPMYVCCAVNV